MLGLFNLIVFCSDLWVAREDTQRKEQGISGLVVEYIVAIDVTRVRFPADAYCHSRGRS